MDELYKLLQGYIEAAAALRERKHEYDLANNRKAQCKREIDTWFCALPDDKQEKLEMSDNTLVVLGNIPFLLKFDFDEYEFISLEPLTELGFKA